MHIHGLCEHTKPRKVPIRLFEEPEKLQAYAGRKLRLCRACEKKLSSIQTM